MLFDQPVLDSGRVYQHHPGKMLKWVPRQPISHEIYRSVIDVGVNEQFPRLARQPLSTISVESVSTFNT
jgi:hypothetical protein